MSSFSEIGYIPVPDRTLVLGFVGFVPAMVLLSLFVLAQVMNRRMIFLLE